eukprot:m.230336 g.230336  ORF g.230336 m.230336 type:complete len:54 (+) comp107924_c0_seq1:406-567(+)
MRRGEMDAFGGTFGHDEVKNADGERRHNLIVLGLAAQVLDKLSGQRKLTANLT